MDTRTGTLVVVAAPGDVVEVSEHSVLAADGYRSRQYEAADVTDGVAVTRLGPGNTTLPWAVSYRVVRGDRNVMTSTPDWVEPSHDIELPSYDIRYPRGFPDDPAARVAQSVAFNVLAPLGLSSGDADVVGHWVGPLPGSHAGTLAVVTATVPSGAVVASVQWQVDSADGLGSYAAECGLEIRPAGVPAADRVYAAACELFDAATGQVTDTSLVVAAPSSVATVRAYDSGGRFLVEFPLADGVLVVPMPERTARVEAVTRTGVLLGRTDLMGHAQLWD